MITERGRRLIQWLAGGLIALLLLLVGGGSDSSAVADDRWIGLPAGEALAAAPCPSATSIARADGEPVDDRRRARAALRGLRPEADRAAARRSTGTPTRSAPSATARTCTSCASSTRCSSSYAGDRQHRGPRRSRSRSASTGSATTRAGSPRPRTRPGPTRSIGDRDPVPRLPAARRRLRATCSTAGRAARAARLARRARPGARRRAQLHARQPRPLRRPRARPADQLPARSSSRRRSGGRSPASASSDPAQAALPGGLARALLGLPVPRDPAARLDAQRARLRRRAGRAARRDAGRRPPGSCARTAS